MIDKRDASILGGLVAVTILILLMALVLGLAVRAFLWAAFA